MSLKDKLGLGGGDMAARKLSQIKALADIFMRWGEDLPEKETLVSVPVDSFLNFCSNIEDLATEAEEALSER